MEMAVHFSQAVAVMLRIRRNEDFYVMYSALVMGNNNFLTCYCKIWDRRVDSRPFSSIE